MDEHLHVRPATEADVEQSAGLFDDLLVDRWRDGGNRRSLVATNKSGVVLGHCRGIDNVFHPESRVYVRELRPGLIDVCPDRARLVEQALLHAQCEVSRLPLHLKIRDEDDDLLRAAREAGGIAIQIAPPWQYRVGPELRAWAETHRGATSAISDETRDALVRLEARHYEAQHARWSPSAPVEQLVERFGGSHDASSESAYDAMRSCVILEADEVVAAGLLWPPDDEFGGGREVSALAWPYEGPWFRQHKEAVLAAIIDSAADGDVLLMDSHVTERVEFDIMQSMPPAEGGYLVITAIPVRGGPAPIPLPVDVVPQDVPEKFRCLIRG